jgi:hypothetical protein
MPTPTAAGDSGSGSKAPEPGAAGSPAAREGTRRDRATARGWQLDQPKPRTMAWVTPSGRSYATGPAAYPG